jgi:DtxR family Mn-dependent transcriptional regulator
MLDAGNAAESLSLPQQRYIEVIAGLIHEHGQARMTAVAERLEVQLPSASEAVKRLVENGLASRNARFDIGLTRKGKRIAEQLDTRHQALKRFMVDVMAMEGTRADELACRIEHSVDKEFTERLLAVAGLLEREYPEALAGIAVHVRNRSKE